MKVSDAKYTVSFNICFSVHVSDGHYAEVEIGEDYMNSVDYIGDDLDELIAEVIASDPSYPMVFVYIEDDKNFSRSDVYESIVGLFYGKDNSEDPVALLS